MTNKSLVSVIIIFLNAGQFLQEAVESVLTQTYEDWELLLVDDGSFDGSSELAKSYEKRYPTRIKYLEHEGHQNLGMSAARNAGMRKANGDYIAFLDADDYWLPDKLEIQSGILESNPKIGMLFGSTKYWFSWTGKAEDNQRDFVPALRVRSATSFDPPKLLLLILDGKIEVPCTCSILIRTDIVRRLGGFEESFKGMYEDQAFYAKVFLSVPVAATDDCLAWYRQHPNSHCSIAKTTGRHTATQYTFLKWLENYCSEQEIHDPTVIQTIRRQLWLHHAGTTGGDSFVPLRAVRWIKKWILRIEEHILPSFIRKWLWIR